MADRHNIIYGLLKTKKEVYKLTKERISIGRNRNSQIVINNNTVSKEHAIIEFDEDYNATIKDLNSSNGTYVNGERLKYMPIKLKTGDIITFGKEKTEYIFESFNTNNDSKTEADINQYIINGNSKNNIDNKMIYDQKINLVNENELSFARMNHFQNNNRNDMLNNKNNIYNNGNFNNNLKNGMNNRNYYNEEDNNNNNYLNNNEYNNLEETYKNKIDELEKRTVEIENEKEELLNKNNELNGEINTKITELKKMTTLFDELNVEYSKLNSKYNALMKYSTDIQKKLDLSNIELSQIKKKSHGNEDTDKIINEKDNIISILQNEVSYYKKLSGKNNIFNTFPSNDLNNNFTINNKLDTLIDKYISENKKLKQQNDNYKRKIKILQKKGRINKNNIDLSQLEIQMNYQIDNFNNIINEYNERLSDSLTKISELFEQSKKEEAAKYLVEQVNDFMKENQRLISENAKLNTEILELQSQLTIQNNLNFNSINQNQINSIEENEIDIDEMNNDEEIDELKNKIDDLEDVISRLKISNNDNNSVKNNSNNNIREAFVNALNELKEKDILINQLQNKIKENIIKSNDSNYEDLKIPIEQNSKKNNDII